MRHRAAALVLAVSTALAAGVGVLASAVPAGAATVLDEVTVSTDTATKPTLSFDAPFAVKKFATSIVDAGSGAALKNGQTLKVDLVVVDARTGEEIESSYGRSTVPVVLDQKQTLKPVVEALSGKKVGSRVLFAVAPKDGVAKKLAGTKVKKNDTLLFVVDVRSVVPTRAAGEAVAPVDGLPTVKLADNGKPKITVPKTAAPTSLVVQPLIKGTGPVVQSGQTVTVQYTGVIWATGKQFDSSWGRGQPFSTAIGKGSVIAGWDEGIVGQTVGSQVLLVVPPDKGYGTTGTSDGSIKGTDTLVFVVDILDAS